MNIVNNYYKHAWELPCFDNRFMNYLYLSYCKEKISREFPCFDTLFMNYLCRLIASNLIRSEKAKRIPSMHIKLFAR